MSSRFLVGTWLLVVAIGVQPGWGQEATSADALPALPEVLEGVDLRLPAQEAFRGWPSEDLRNRQYWLPWSAATFQRAATFNRPVFLFLNARWNRAAQRAQLEVLRDPEVLKVLNGGYICVMVHADRRPDVAERFRTGTWPVMALLLPDGHPMISEADVEESMGRPIFIGSTDAAAMKFLLEEGLVYWSRYRNRLFGLGYRWADESDPPDPRSAPLSPEVVDGVVDWMQANFDGESGGFGAAPKYVLGGLTRLGWMREAADGGAVREMARGTMNGMLTSPLRDRRYGGIHRMAAAPAWDSIQYEKLLDRNVTWLRELTSALEQGAGEDVRMAALETARFLTETLARPGGGFFLAQAADFRSPDGGGYWRGETSEVPFIDRLVLSGPNALAGAALARAGWALDRPALRDAGRGALDLVVKEAVRQGRGARHVLDGSDDESRFLETQAEVAFGLVEGYQATGDMSYLDAATDVALFAIRNLLEPTETAMRDHFAGAVEVGLLARPRRPLPANVTMARALLRIADLTGDEELRGHAEGILTTWAGSLPEFGRSAIDGALAVEEALTPPVVVRLPAGADDLRREALRAGPWVLVDTLPAGEEGGTAIVSRRGEVETVSDSSGLKKAVRRLMEATQ